MSANKPNSHIVVIDTDSYSGNFERQMCAFITSRVGMCGVGTPEAVFAREQVRHLDWYEDHVTDEADDNGCERPASIWPTPRRFNDGYGGHHDDTPEARAKLRASQRNAQFPAYESVAIFVDTLPPAQVLAEMVERARQFCQDRGIGYKGFRLLAPRHTTRQVRAVAGHVEVAPPAA